MIPQKTKFNIEYLCSTNTKRYILFYNYHWGIFVTNWVEQQNIFNLLYFHNINLFIRKIRHYDHWHSEQTWQKTISLPHKHDLCPHKFTQSKRVNCVRIFTIKKFHKNIPKNMKIATQKKHNCHIKTANLPQYTVQKKIAFNSAYILPRQLKFYKKHYLHVHTLIDLCA